MPIPSQPWLYITIDFVEGLPNSQGFNSVWVVVDRLTKYAHFVPLSHPFLTKTVALFFVKHILKLHGMPQSIVSDRGSVFTSLFWKELFKI